MPPVTAKQRVEISPRKGWIDGYGRKDFAKRRVFRRQQKTRRGRSTSGPEYTSGLLTTSIKAKWWHCLSLVGRKILTIRKTYQAPQTLRLKPVRCMTAKSTRGLVLVIVRAGIYSLLSNWCVIYWPFRSVNR